MGEKKCLIVGGHNHYTDMLQATACSYQIDLSVAAVTTFAQMGVRVLGECKVIVVILSEGDVPVLSVVSEKIDYLLSEGYFAGHVLVTSSSDEILQLMCKLYTANSRLKILELDFVQQEILASFEEASATSGFRLSSSQQIQAHRS